MFKIAICDDEKLILKEVSKIIENYLQELNIKCEIDTFEYSNELWERYEQGGSYDLVFLDINMEQMDGIALGNKIRTNLDLENNQIVYISSEKGKAEEMLNLRIFGFVFKGDMFKENIKEIIKKYSEVKNYNMEYIEIVDNKDGKVKIFLKDINYFESKLKRVYAITEDKSYQIRKNLKELDGTLPKKAFIRINNYIIVNGDKVKDYEYKSIIMETGEVIKISQTYRVEARRYFLSRR